MDRHGKLFILALLAIALGVGAWLALGTTPPPLPSETTATTPGNGEVTNLGTERLATGESKTQAVERAEIEAKAPPEEIDPEIAAAMAKYVGRVVEFDGKPAAQRVVRLFRVDPRVLFQPGFDLLSAPIADLDGATSGETTTGDDGRFELPGVWPKSVYLLKADVGGSNPTIKIVQKTPAPAETCDLGDIVLKNGAIVTGRVVDESGDPIAGAMVRAADVPAMVTQFVPVEQFDLDGFVIGGNGDEQMVVEMPAWVKKYWLELPIPTTTTDSEGRFTLTGIEPGLNMVAATKSGLLAAVQRGVKLAPGQKREVGKLVLREGEEATGRVLDSSGKPVVGAEIVIGAKLAGVPVTLTRPAVRSDAQGKFECTGLGSGDIVAAARRAPGERWTVAPAQTVAKEITFTLPSRQTLNVRLVSEPGLTITAPKLRLVAAVGESNEGLPVMAALGFAREVDIGAKLTKMPDGRLQIRELEAGSYLLVAAAEQHALASRKIELLSDLDIELRLPAESAIDVTVLDPRGKGQRNATIFVEAEAGGPESMPYQAGRTSAAGTLRARVAPCQTARVHASHPRYGVVSAEAKLPATAPLVMTFQEPGTIAGVVSDAGKPPKLGEFVVSAQRPWQEVRGPIGAMPQFQPLAADGKFAFTGLQPGNWRVEVIKSLDAIRSFGSMTEMMWSAWEGQQLPEQDVVVTPNATTQVQLDLATPRVVEGPSARISGTAFIDGQPATGMLIFGWGQGRVSGTVDGAGRFDLGLVQEGHVWLNLADRSDEGVGPMRRSLWSKSVEVKGGNDVTLTIALSTSTVSGAVTGHDGRPAANVAIDMNCSKDGVSHQARGLTDGSGRFEIKRVPEGSYTVTARSAEYGRGHTTVTLAAGTHATDVRIQLARTYKVKGRVDMSRLPKNDEGNWAYLAFEPQDGSGQATGESVDGKDGSFTADDIAAGRYRVRVHCPGPDEWVHESVVEVTGDIDGLNIVPVRIQPQAKPIPEEAKKDE